jgi:hypothetical protein
MHARLKAVNDLKSVNVFIKRTTGTIQITTETEKKEQASSTERQPGSSDLLIKQIEKKKNQIKAGNQQILIKSNDHDFRQKRSMHKLKKQRNRMFSPDAR